MEQEQLDQLLLLNASKFPPEAYAVLRERLERCDANRVMFIMNELKDPTLALILSILLGEFGLDRIYVGDVGLGICKLITGGGCGIWWFIDLFLIMRATREANLRMVLSMA